MGNLVTLISCWTMRATKVALAFGLVCMPGIAAADKLQEGMEAFHQGRYSVAAATLKDLSDDQARAFYALSQAALNHCEAALPELSKANRDDATLTRLTGIAAARCEAQLGKEASAFALLDRLQQRFPHDPDVLYTAAKLHMKAFNDSTLKMFQRTPASYRVHELSAEIFEVQSRFSDAVAEYRKAIELNSTAPDLHFRLGRAILLQSHDPKALDQAAGEFRAELKLSPEDSASEFQLGQIAVVQQKPDEAKVHLRQALTLSPDFVAALVLLAKVLSGEKNYSSAIDLLSKAVRLQPENESAHYALMTAYRNSGRMAEAKSEKATLDRLQKPPSGEFSEFLKKLGEKPVEQ